MVHSNYALPDNQRCLRSFYIDPEFFHGLADQIERPKQENYFNKNCFKDTAVWERFARLHEILLKNPLIRLFRKHKNMSPHAFLIQIRLEHGRLIEKGADITITALASGFSDQSHLTRKFKARYGITPHAYKVSHCF